MIEVRKLTGSIRLALVAGAMSALAMPVAAQDQDGQDAAATLDRIEVTGTRISTPGIVANSPISSYSAADLAITQSVSVEDFLKLVPGAVPAIGPGTNNGSGGGATIDLRGLGANRTLVLINGRRVVPFNLAGVVDTNFIPIALIDRIDLVTGGASAVYGADAVAGVVNFILKRDFEGAEFHAQYGTSSEGDGDRQMVDFTVGGNFADGRGNVVMSVGHTRTDPVLQGDRAWGLVSRNSVTGNPEGSGTTVPALIFNNSGLALTEGSVCADGSIDFDCFQSFNFNPLNLFQTPLDRLQGSAFGRFELTDRHEVYGEAMYTRSIVKTQLAPSGTFFNDYLVPVGNPFIPELARQQLCADLGIAPAACTVGNPTEALLTIGRRFTELGPRLNDFENRTFQGTVGFRGDLTDTWRYDVYYSFGEADQVQSLGNWGSNSRVQQALRSIAPGTCTDTSNGCVPLNVFGAEGTITQAMIDFFNLDALQRQTVQQDVFSAQVSGDLGDRMVLPWTSYPISLAGGYEHREATAGTKSDQASQINGEVLGTGAPNPDSRGTFTLEEAFVEFFVPIVNDAAWAYSLSFEGGYRRSKFSTAANSESYNTYKYGGEWAPTESFRVRGLAQRATRAPNIAELFAPVVTGLDNLAVDPCQGASINQADANTPGTLSNLCRLTGVPLNVIGGLPAPSAGQVNVLVGGNPNLQPEVADSRTVGLVWEPSFVDRLTITLDYYDIEVTGAITTPSVDDVLGDCYSTARNPGLTFNAACALVGRNPNNGTFNGTNAPGINLGLSNLGVLRTDGFDLAVFYGFGLGDWGDLNFALNMNKVQGWNFQATPNSVDRDCNGLYSISCGVLHDFKSNLRTTWSISDFQVSLAWRHLGSIREETGNFLPAYSSIPSYNYFDLGASWRANDNLRISLSVDNVFNKKPPEVGNTIAGTAINSGNSFPQYYDSIGRFMTLGATVTF